MAFYPVEHPNFRQRGKRKPLSFELDFSNPILQKYKLKNAIIAINDTTAIDFVTGDKHKSSSSSSPNSGYPDGIYINNDGNLGTFSHVIEKGCFVAHAKCTATYSTGTSRYLLNWSGSGEVVQLLYNGFSSGRNYQLTTRGGFGTTIQALAAPKVTSDSELQEAEFVVAGWDLDVGSSVDVGAPKIYNGTGGASTDDTNERSITICSSGWVGVFYSLFVFEEDLPTDIKYELSRNPYQLLKPSIDVLWFVASGGANYNVSASFGLSQGLAQSGSAQALGGITLANSISCSDAANGNYQGASTLANQLSVSNGGLAQALSTATLANQIGYSTEGIIAFLVDVSFASTMGDTYSGTATGQGAINLGTSLDQTVSAIAQTIASVTLSTSQGLTSSSGNTIAGAISLGVSSGMTALGSFTIAGNITLSKTLADSINVNAQTNASINLGAQVGLTVLAQAAAQAGITLTQVVSVVNTATTIIFGVTAPDGRVYTVEIDTRSLVVSAENRTLTIDSEDRTLTVN